MIAEKIVSNLENKFDIVEVYIESTKSKEFELKNSKEFSKSLSIDKGCGIRVVKNSKEAFAYMSLDDNYKNNIDKITDDILLSIELSKKLDCDILNKNRERYARSRGISVKDNKIKNKIYLMDDVAKNFDKKIVDVKGASIAFSEQKFEIANSYGMNIKDSKTYVSSSVSVLAQDKTADMGWYSLDADNFEAIDFEYIAQEASNRALNKLHPQSISTKKYSIILSSDVFTQILAHFFPIFDGYSVINNTTYLKDKMNDKIFSSEITIEDSVSLKNRPNSVLFDAEGQRRNNTVVVKNGVLKSFLHNTYTSKMLNMKNSANAKRAGYASSPKVGAFNFHIKPSKKTKKESLISQIDGLYISEIMGLHMANNISGDFSLGVSGFFIHNGEFLSYFKSATFAGNFFDIMTKIIGISDNMYFSGSFGSPDIAIADCVIGGE